MGPLKSTAGMSTALREVPGLVGYKMFGVWVRTCFSISLALALSGWTKTMMKSGLSAYQRQEATHLEKATTAHCR